MDWVVKNALSRDTEREHLNKILAEIRSALSGSIQVQPPVPAAPITVTTGSSGSTGVDRQIKITLTGDVTGESSGATSISIPTIVTSPGLRDAPIDGSAYWRLDGGWSSVPSIVRALSGFDADGFLSWDSDDGSFIAREIEGTVDQISVSNGLGIAANPIISLSDLSDSGTGSFKLITRDAKGRLSGTADGTTDDVPEGVINLYFTDERAQDAVGAAITAGSGDGVTLTYDDVGNKIDAVNTDKGSVAVAAHVAAPDPHPQYAAHTLAPSLPNVDVVAIPPGAAVARIGGGYVLADKALPDRWNVVGIYIGDTAVPVADKLQPRVEGVVTMTALQWDAVLGTVGGLATRLTYFLGTAGVLSVTPPTTVGEYNVAVGLALSATDLHIRDMRPIQL